MAQMSLPVLPGMMASCSNCATLSRLLYSYVKPDFPLTMAPSPSWGLRKSWIGRFAFPVSEIGRSLHGTWRVAPQGSHVGAGVAVPTRMSFWFAAVASDARHSRGDTLENAHYVKCMIQHEIDGGMTYSDSTLTRSRHEELW